MNFMKMFQLEEDGFLKDSLTLRLKDENPSVVEAALAIGQVCPGTKGLSNFLLNSHSIIFNTFLESLASFTLSSCTHTSVI